MKRYITILFLMIVLNNVQAQITPEFKFYLAFEDATNTKDTLWFILDSTATFGIDTALGEVPQNLTSPVFHSYMYLSNTPDSGKTFATPSLSCVSNAGGYIYAQNYVYPIIVRWDTSLLINHNLSCNDFGAIFDNDWFFYNPNHQSGFNLLFQDSVVLPNFNWGSQNHFPLTFIIRDNLTTSLKEISPLLTDIKIYPNPVINDFTIEMDNNNLFTVQLILKDISGRIIQQYSFTGNTTVINTQKLPKGIYFLEVLIENEKVIKKIIKN